MPPSQSRRREQGKTRGVPGERFRVGWEAVSGRVASGRGAGLPGHVLLARAGHTSLGGPHRCSGVAGESASRGHGAPRWGDALRPEFSGPGPPGLSSLPHSGAGPRRALAGLCLPAARSGAGPELSPCVPQKLFGFLLEHVGDLAAQDPPDLGVVDKLVV